MQIAHAETDREAARRGRRAGIASFMGTTIEWYDFYIYGLAASLVFGKLFFPPDLDPSIATILSFLTLWIGFLARPIGGIIFGHIGDRVGRKKTLVITLIMMGLATTGMGVLPVYEQAGALAPALLVLLRTLQGIAVGGEWGGAVLIASENAPKGKGIIYSAFAQQGAPVGNLLAIMMFYLLSSGPTPAFLLNGGWRIPFLVSVVLVVVGMVIRLSIEDAQGVRKLIDENKSSRPPAAEIIRDYPVLLLLAVGTSPIIYVTYIKTNFATSWATGSLGYDTSTFLGMVWICVVVQCVTQPFGAVLASRMDMRKAVLLMTIPEILLMPFMFYAIQTKVYWLALTAMCVATIPHGMFYGAIGGLLARSFPTRIRYSGLSLANQLGAVLIGGGTPALAQMILYKTGSIVGVAMVSASYALISMACMLGLLKLTGFKAGEPSHAEKADEAELSALRAGARMRAAEPQALRASV